MAGDPQLTPDNVKRMVDAIKTRATRLQLLEELMTVQLPADTRQAVRAQYLAETDAANR